MASYCVNFYRVLLSSDGHPFRCLQGQIDVPRWKAPRKLQKLPECLSPLPCAPS